MHLYGQPADMAPILELAERHGLWVVEDASQAHLARYNGRLVGSMGVAAAFSFYPAKNLGACGEAGAITTNDPKIGSRVRQLRDHGQSRKHYHEFEGYNGRCDALQAAALSVKLKHLQRHNEARGAVAESYCEYLRGAENVVLPRVIERCLPVWHLFVVQVNRRDTVQKALADRGIGTGLHYPIPLHLQEAYRCLGYREGHLPVAESCAQRVLTLPMYPGLTGEQIRYVCDALVEVTGFLAEEPA